MSELSKAEATPVAAVEVVEDAANWEIVVQQPPMTQVEAQQCLQQIKDLGNSLRAKLLELDLRRGWKALGYSSMTACLKAEFAEVGSKSTMIREWNAGQLERELEVQICTYPAYQLRPLRKLQPEQRKAVLAKAQELAGDARFTANHVTQAVSEVLSPTRFVKQTLPAKYKPGELIRIQCQAGALPEQKVWDGCWGIVQSTGNISCVRVLVGSKEIDCMAGDLDWDDNSDVKFRDTCERILTLWQTELEPIEQTVLKELQRRHFFTDLEKQMIVLMEAKRLSLSMNEQTR